MDHIKKINIISGHYGSGKTNLAVNLALDCRRRGEDVTLIDLDIVNPYFRSADFTAELEGVGIKAVNPAYANSNLDIPALTAEIQGTLEQAPGRIIIDVGGDDAGAAALGRYARTIQQQEYGFFYVINQYRYLSRSPREAAEILEEIQAASRMKATGIVNNSNLGAQTTGEDVLAALNYGRETARLTGLPLAAVAYPRALGLSLEQGYPVELYVKPPWEERPALIL